MTEARRISTGRRARLEAENFGGVEHVGLRDKALHWFSHWPILPDSKNAFNFATCMKTLVGAAMRVRGRAPSTAKYEGSRTDMSVDVGPKCLDLA